MPDRSSNTLCQSCRMSRQRDSISDSLDDPEGMFRCDTLVEVNEGEHRGWRLRRCLMGVVLRGWDTRRTDFDICKLARPVGTVSSVMSVVHAIQHRCMLRTLVDYLGVKVVASVKGGEISQIHRLATKGGLVGASIKAGYDGR